MSDFQESGKEILDIQTFELLDALTRSHQRIAELEASERLLHRERDHLVRDLGAIRGSITSTLFNHDDIHRFPAARTLLLQSLTPIQRREVWLSAMSSLGVSGAAFALFPHDGGDDPINILVVGSGGFGDMLYLTPVIRALHEMFNGARIIVAHENSKANQIFDGNPYVFQTISLPPHAMRDFMSVATSLDIFDLVSEVRYVVSHITPPLSRVPASFVELANSRATQWQRYARFDWPHQNNLFAREVVRRGMSKLDLVGHTANLPIDRHSQPDLLAEPDLEEAALAPLHDVRYVTVHHGADASMGAASGLQTKNLPIATWITVVRDLQRQGVTVVQLGEHHEALIEGIDVDLRGRTDFNHTAAVIQGASAHIDTEGGLVHVARAVGTPSVVAFGPTPPAFFGYPGNANLAPPLCGDCWWTTRSWARACPRQMSTPECMSHEASAITKSAAEILRVSMALRLDGMRALELDPTQIEDTLASDKILAEALKIHLADNALILVDTLATAHFVAKQLSRAAGAAEPTLYVPKPIFQKAVEELGSEIVIRPFSPTVTPALSQQFASGFAIVGSVCSPADLHLLREMGRCIKVGGQLDVVARRFAPAGVSADSLEDLEIPLKRQLGRKMMLEGLLQAAPPKAGLRSPLHLTFRVDLAAAAVTGAGRRGASTSTAKALGWTRARPKPVAV